MPVADISGYAKLSEFDNHQAVIELGDSKTGLRGFIAIHSTRPGPALGATRMRPYSSDEEALNDALRLARAMTYKCAIAGLAHGGAKAVLIGDAQIDKTPALLRKYAEEINKLKGKFYTGEDVGISAEDVYYMQQFSNYFIGAKDKAGDSAPYAALGVFNCIQVALGKVYGSGEIKDKTVAIKGLGKTGLELAKLILENGGNVIASEINEDRLNFVTAQYPQIEVVSPQQIYSAAADIFAPCALGDDLSQQTAAVLKAKIICGTANNQLTSSEVGDQLFEKGYIYIPDYLANAGGLIDVADELEPGGYSRERVLHRIDQLSKTCREILAASQSQNIPPHRVADKMAEAIFIKEYV